MNSSVAIGATVGSGVIKSKKKRIAAFAHYPLVPGTGIEPVQPQWPQDFLTTMAFATRTSYAFVVWTFSSSI